MLYKRCKCPEGKCAHPFWYVFVLDGVRYRRTTKTANRQTAERVELRRRAAVLENRDEKPTKTVMLSKHVADYLKYTKAHNVTADKDQAVLDRLLENVGNRPIGKVSPFHVERWKQKRSSEVSKNTVNREMNIVRGCFSRAVEWRLIAQSPCVGVKDFPVDDVRVRVLEDEELRAVINCGDPFVTLLARITVECLARLSEALAIERRHIGADWVELRRKGGLVSRAAITPELRQLLIDRCHPVSGFVFGEDAEGVPPARNTSTNRVVTRLRALGIQNASHHTFRHTGVTLMLEAGVNPRAIQHLAGWSSLRMLERYGHVRDREMRRAVDTVAARLKAVAEAPATPQATEKPAGQQTA